MKLTTKEKDLLYRALHSYRVEVSLENTGGDEYGNMGNTSSKGEKEIDRVLKLENKIMRSD
jgi:hypothetical protein|tara:strand:- start:76 stop:258 length:183 start_codon:yes stop_codon:yes gene_type:complete